MVEFCSVHDCHVIVFIFSVGFGAENISLSSSPNSTLVDFLVVSKWQSVVVFESLQLII